jgi:hypothetical protein
MDYKKVIKFYFNRKSPLPEDQMEKKRMPHQTQYFETFSKSEKRFFWFFAFAFIGSLMLLLELILRII